MDLDGDGKLDLLSGSWPGAIYFFRGKGKSDFEAPQKIKDKEGELLEPGGGIDESGDILLIRGEASFENTKEGTIVFYRGKRLKNTSDNPIGLTGCATAVHAADWNGDGVFDLIVGDVQGRVWLVPNEGTAKKYAFGKPRLLEADSKQLNVPHGDAGPCVADWDGDGKLDLIVGAGDGSVWFYRNLGDAKAPKLAAGRMLAKPGKTVVEPAWVPCVTRRGIRAKVCVVDWNGDGRLDLLVGDFAMQRPNRPEPTPAERAEQDRIRKELKTVQERYSTLSDKLQGPKRERNLENRKKLGDEIQQVDKKMWELQKKLPPDFEEHGWVWLYLRKPAETKAAK